MPGRWFAHLFKGQVFHRDITQAKEVPSELLLGWLFHYGVGVAYGILFLLIVGTEWLANPRVFVGLDIRIGYDCSGLVCPPTRNGPRLGG